MWTSRARSMVDEQAAHVMPVMENSCLCGAVRRAAGEARESISIPLCLPLLTGCATADSLSTAMEVRAAMWLSSSSGSGESGSECSSGRSGLACCRSRYCPAVMLPQRES